MTGLLIGIAIGGAVIVVAFGYWYKAEFLSDDK